MRRRSVDVACAGVAISDLPRPISSTSSQPPPSTSAGSRTGTMRYLQPKRAGNALLPCGWRPDLHLNSPPVSILAPPGSPACVSLTVRASLRTNPQAGTYHYGVDLPAPPGTIAYTWLGYAGRSVVSGDISGMHYGLLGLGVLAMIAFLPQTGVKV
jgi:murein DD-endopeptidase MepM/ murein hydrolase activator NlpD